MEYKIERGDVGTWGRGDVGTWGRGDKSTSHEPRATSHEPRATSHEPRATGHEPQARDYKLSLRTCHRDNEEDVVAEGSAKGSQDCGVDRVTFSIWRTKPKMPRPTN